MGAMNLGGNAGWDTSFCPLGRVESSDIGRPGYNAGMNYRGDLFHEDEIRIFHRLSMMLPALERFSN